MSCTNAPRWILTSAWLLAAAGIAGCSDSTGPDRPLTPEEAEALGFSIATEVETSLGALLANGLLSGVESQTAGAARPRLNGASLAAVAEPECSTPSQNPILDDDEDQVPNDVTFGFTVANCTFQLPGGSMSISGSIRLSDPFPQTSGFSYNGTVTNLRVSFTGEEGTFSVTQNGSVSVTVDASQLTLTQSFVSAVSASGVPGGASITNTLSATFTPAAGSALVVGQPLPDGVFIPSSSITISQAGQGGVFTLSAPTPLQYSAECAASAISPFTAGELRATISTTEGNGYVRIRYTDCGEPDVLFIAAN
jgi:hypothetical protein